MSTDRDSGPWKRRVKRIPLFVFFIGALLVGFVGSVGVLREWRHHFAPQSNVQTVPTGKTIPYSQGHLYTPPVRNGSPSPLLFGTNLRLLDGNDQVLTSKSTRIAMQLIHVRIVRLPIHSGLSDDLVLEAAQDIKNINAIPLVALEGAQQPGIALNDDLQVVRDMNQIFGKSLVYYEFGNEDDNNGVSIDQYTTAWNTIVPQLKAVALQANFVGPVSYQYNHENVATFLQHASPRPDEISWHEYTCSAASTESACLDAISTWSTHIADARASMQSLLGLELPIMITSWSYTAPQSLQPDAKDTNASFVSNWTSKALHTLADNHVFASMQYSVTDIALPLIAKDTTLTTMGTTFQSLYLQMISGNEFNG
jgi:hypothetical protein